MNYNVGQYMKSSKENTLKKIVQIIGYTVYMGGILFTASHNWSLLTAGVSDEMLFLAIIGVFSLELTALALPLALHFWAYAPAQRIAAYIFYVADFCLVIGNVIIDHAVISGATSIPEWLALYKFFIVPATPIFTMIGWTTLFLLDPEQKKKATLESLRASANETLSRRIIDQASKTDVSQHVDRVAAKLTRSIIGEELGDADTDEHYDESALFQPSSTALPGIDRKSMYTIARDNGKHQN